MSSTTPKRKRSRAQSDEDDDLDELSQKKTTNLTPISTSVKRRKLATYTSASTKKGLLSSIGSLGQKLAGGLWGNGQSGKENRQDEHNVDELAEGKDIWDVVSTDDEGKKADRSPIKEKGSAKKMVKAILNVEKATPRRRSAAEQLKIDMVGYGSDEDGTPKSTSKNGHKKAQLSGSTSKSEAVSNATNKDGSIKKKRGRPSKATLLKNAKAQASEEKRLELSLADRESDGEPPSKQKTRKKRVPQITEGSLPPSDSEQAISSSINIKSKRELNRLGIDMVDSPISAPKGILTPSKKDRVVRPQKSVTFRKSNEDLNLGFKDLPTSADGKRAHAKTKKALEAEESFLHKVKVSSPTVQEMDSEEELIVAGEVIETDEEEDIAESEDRSRLEETACSICSKLHSPKGNQILLCDGCDLAVHQKCYSVPVIPKGDWFCRDCKSQPDRHTKMDVVDLPDIEGFEGHLGRIQRTVLDRLTGKTRIKIAGHDDQLQKLVESVISDISKNDRDKFHVVRLNGFVHTDDKLASREIWRQLGREMEIEDDSVKASNHADTLASLLALLSHPAEQSELSSHQTAKSVVFILDEFDLFTTHARQTLLYNLFDIAQARKAPIAVLGLTTRIDVVESLEKRVKSRFSHRYVYLSHPRSPPNFWDIAREALIVSPTEKDSGYLDTSIPGQNEFVSFWNTMIDGLYAEDNEFKDHVQSQFYRTKSIPAFMASCIMPVASLSTKQFPLVGKAFRSCTLSLGPPDSKLQMLQGLSELELSLLIAAARLDIILDTDTCNFAMVYDEYSSLTSRHKIQTSSTGLTAMGSGAKVWGRDVALDAWEKLAEYELLVPLSIGGGNTRGQDSGASGHSSSFFQVLYQKVEDMEQFVNVSGFGGAAIPPSKAHFVKQDLESVICYGEAFVSVFHEYALNADKVPRGFDGITNIFDASLATLTKVSSIFKDESLGQRYKAADHPLNEKGLSYVAGLVLESARAWKVIESAIADTYLTPQEHRAKMRTEEKALKNGGKKAIDISTLNLDQKALLEKLEDMDFKSWNGAEDNVENAVEMLYDIQLCLLLVFQVVTVGALSKKNLSSGTVDVAAIVKYHNRIKRTARLAGIPMPKERKSLESSDSDGSSSLSDCDTIGSSRKSSKRPTFAPIPLPPPPPAVRENVPCPPPPPGIGVQTAILPPLLHPTLDSIRTTTPPLSSAATMSTTETVNPPSYTESHKTPEVTMPTSSPDKSLEKDKKEMSEKASTSDNDGSHSESGSDEETEPAVIEPRLFKSKPNGITFKLRTMFQSKESLALEMRKALSDTESRLMAFVIQGSTNKAIPHSSFHSLEATHMRTILSQLRSDAWYKTFTMLNSAEHMALGRITRFFSEGKMYEREVLVLKVIQETSRLTAWTALLGDLRRGNTHSTDYYGDSRTVLAIVRDQLVNGKPREPMPSINRMPPPPRAKSQYHSASVFRPPPSSYTLPVQPNITTSDISRNPMPRPPGQGAIPPPQNPPYPFGLGTVIPPAPPGFRGVGTAPRPPQGPAPKSTSSVQVSDITIGNNHEAELALTSYKECTMRRCQAETPQADRSWLRVTTTLESSSPESVKLCVTKFAAYGSVLASKLKMSEEQADQVSRLIDSFRLAERDMRFEWCWVVLALLDNSGNILNNRPNQVVQQMTQTIHLVAKRSLKACYRPLDVYNAMMRVNGTSNPGPPPLPSNPNPHPLPPVHVVPLQTGNYRYSKRRSYGSDNYDSGSDDSVGYVKRRIRKVKSQNRTRGYVAWSRDRYTRRGSTKIQNTFKKSAARNYDFISGSDTESEEEEDLVQIVLHLQRGEDIVQRLLALWTPQQSDTKEEIKA
ncbi:FYVE/PHD zinc finger [Glarea lozoyensis ATCC 20868]|uniref:FYVE/PHD zinc finger n=1 Tax=Glarea lozoyensis (strain ATCC 20868 / MF5171) TaxID=1116229 RepID=S3DYB6_GLAL2|nr:FYVE/PHD zinc finger [Glarea lozoyensis ATCC 20868]EPE31323.1 FYVE/PHD zinc finger [Glarea lozoyensis ATCC 20868]